MLNQREVLRLFKAGSNLKHRAIAMTIYAAGLRASEVAHLQVEDIDSERMLIHVREGGSQGPPGAAVAEAAGVAA